MTSLPTSLYGALTVYISVVFVVHVAVANGGHTEVLITAATVVVVIILAIVVG